MGVDPGGVVSQSGAALIALVAIAAASSSLAAPAAARDDDRREVRIQGSCSGRSDWKLSAKARDGGLEVEFEVESTRGRRPPWRISVARDGVQIAEGVRRPSARTGELRIERRTTGSVGISTITAHAQNARSGEICLATARI